MLAKLLAGLVLPKREIRRETVYRMTRISGDLLDRGRADHGAAGRRHSVASQGC